MPRFISHSSRRVVAALALATTLAIPALAIIAGQDTATASGSQPTTVNVASIKWHSIKWH